MFASLLAAELYITLRRRFFRVTLAGMTGLLVILMVAMHLAAQVALHQGVGASGLPVVLWPDGLLVVLNSLLSPSFLGGIMAATIATVLWTEEYRWGMLHFWLSRGAPRATLLGAKAVAVVSLLFLSLLVGLIAGGGVAVALTALSAGAGPTASMHWGQLLLGLLRSTLAVLPIAALALLLGVLTRSTAGALGAAIGYLLLGEQLLSGLLGLIGLSTIGMYLPIALGKQLTMHNSALLQSLEGASVSPLGGYVACVGVLLWTAGLLGWAMWTFGRQDLSP